MNFHHCWLLYFSLPRERNAFFPQGDSIAGCGSSYACRMIFIEAQHKTPTMAVAAVMREFKTSASASVVPTRQQTNATG